MYEIKIQTDSLKEANEIVKVIDREENEGSLLDFSFSISLNETPNTESYDDGFDKDFTL